MNTDTYYNNRHTRKFAEITVERFYINDTPVCLSWYGCDKHETEACVFLRFRKFGTVPYCTFLDQDCNNEPDTINCVLADCPIHKEEVCKN